jgi:hypothetical protein
MVVPFYHAGLDLFAGFERIYVPKLWQSIETRYSTYTILYLIYTFTLI